MTEEQLIHIGMINSFNILTERNTFDEIVTSEMSYIAHLPQDPVDIELVRMMVDYFESYEMFEHCSELIGYINKNYDSNGKAIKHGCECPQPVITEYSSKMFCGKCNKRLVR